MINTKYQLKLTVGQNSYVADINWGNTLDCVFNKRHRRIPDYGSAPYQSASSYLSDYMTKAILIGNGSLLKIPKDDVINWRGNRDTEYTNFSGTIGKVTLASEIFTRNMNKTFYTMSLGDMIEDASVSNPVQANVEGDGWCGPFCLDPRDNTLIYHTNSYFAGSYNFHKIKVEKSKWGLDGCSGISYRDRMNQQTTYNAERSIEVSNECRHDYTFHPEYLLEHFDVDKQRQTQTFGDVDVSYDTWNCCFAFRNDSYGISLGDSYTHNDDYIIVNEPLLYKVLRVGQYNSPSTPYATYPFKPTGCDVYYNMTTRKFEFENVTETFEMFMNYQIIEKENLSSVVEGEIKLTNTFTIDTSLVNFTGLTDISEYTTFILNATNYSESYITTNKIPARMFLLTTDGNKIFIGGGFQSTTYAVYSYDINDLLNQNESLTLTLEATSDLQNFLHTYIRKNLYAFACIPSTNNSDIGYIINQETGVVDDVGFFKWVTSGEADFGGVSIASGQTFKFELIETLSGV